MRKIFIVLFLCLGFFANAQQRYELNTGWLCANVKDVNLTGVEVSNQRFSTSNWMKATVPGTVLTSLLNNNKVPDPFYGMNNEKIADVYRTGNDYYTYWFVKDFEQKALGSEQIWLQFRGINYKADVYLNGKKVNQNVIEGMHLRSHFNITKLLAENGKNRLAVIVHPPDVVGNPNGGQGGDGTIAKGLTTQYTAGWDWIQPIRDRNTGIWDKVTIEKTVGINLKNPHVITMVPGKRLPEGKQKPATVKMSVEVENPTEKVISGLLQYQFGGQTIQKQISIKANQNIEVSFPDLVLQNPKLWWPNGYGEQYLYDANIKFISNAQTLDQENLKVGVRQIDNLWNEQTRSMGAYVNGQKIFIKGGNWIISDAMLRFSDARYDAEVRYHKDMNLNLIRIWGGAILERPEFYNACDKYGLLVFQDFWFSGDCNGRWVDPMKKDDQWTRRKYPDNHNLVLTAIEDQVKMIRNHASLAFWCGGNEITPPADILQPMKDDILPRLDGTRILFDFSNSDEMSFNSLGGNGDGPYGIQNPTSFWANKTFPYNSEVGSVGVGDFESLERFIPKENLLAPQFKEKPDSVWDYHKYIGYDEYINPYGKAKDAKDFAMKAQLVNYDQYRALMEGFSSHMWEWYTGSIIWKTQNPWTAMRGQMYDYYLDPNACLYGLRKGSEPLHVMMNPLDSMVTVVNNGFLTRDNLMVQAKVYDMDGKDYFYSQVFNSIGPSSVRRFFPLNDYLKKLDKKDGVFVSLRILDESQKVLSENLYWLPAKDGEYKGLQKMKSVAPEVKATQNFKGKVLVTLTNSAGNPVAFFNRIALIDAASGKRILPAFYDDNYISILPGESKTVTVEYHGNQKTAVEVYGWNVEKTRIEVN
ncbi:glycoside hydrolase family 2 TIM barrel-domain containing protein [Pedobacter sp. Leaf194]|uniref:glycoside hydrolase family 2 protein n=1 Tax=Pedobacter sp. Leaf194 TaxID=1736297 RepID=UPI000702F546|nr:glycoside hydrolase family 2 TIM barrel-domain containing protein [Pedobacter sp. Leaf194]KQS41209.1 glycosyl hydrolase [Pedobacter sp. Leaf194]